MADYTDLSKAISAAIVALKTEGYLHASSEETMPSEEIVGLIVSTAAPIIASQTRQILMETTYDFNDPDIREMVERNHKPEETYIKQDYTVVKAIITCGSDGESWPCSPVIALRKFTMQGKKEDTDGLS